MNSGSVKSALIGMDIRGFKIENKRRSFCRKIGKFDLMSCNIIDCNVISGKSEQMSSDPLPMFWS